MVSHPQARGLSVQGVEWLAYNGSLDSANSVYSLAGATTQNATLFSRYAAPDSAAPRTAALHGTCCSVGLLSQGPGGRTSKVEGRAGLGAPEASLLTLSLCVLT